MPGNKHQLAWIKLTVKVGPEAAPGIVDVLLSMARGVEQRFVGSQVWLIAYLPTQGDVRRVVGRVRERLTALREAGLDIGRASVTTRRISSRRWEDAWKAGLGVVRVTPRLAVKPTWKDYVPAPGEVVVELDPGMAFGTGHHATSRGCLDALARLVRGGEVVFDVGAGSGILSIAAAKLGARRVVGIEVDHLAARIAADNVALNRAAESVAVICGSGLRCVRGAADIIIANLTAVQITELAQEARARLRRGGILIASGIAAPQAAAVREAVAHTGMTLRESRERDDWVTMVWEARKDASPAG
jgi:ribosomal protein L11 methyltransferase